jgi:hypothetical protein
MRTASDTEFMVRSSWHCQKPHVRAGIGASAVFRLTFPNRCSVILRFGAPLTALQSVELLLHDTALHDTLHLPNDIALHRLKTYTPQELLSWATT